MHDLFLGRFPKVQQQPTFRLEMQIGEVVKVEHFTAMDNHSAERKAVLILQANVSPAAILYKGNDVQMRFAEGYKEK